ncbi:calcium-dependent protein kinase [Reticulomyxa filosa]|uniref:Calcium-dependent protein kinase n=1 Tax=Reticulomyxa filosa TaxID=46433 RepID=X6NDM9_RETFI|nr:calcium-dependent protein kinase [Reticulomyxa filosa]|eukprot:ETO23432.1 calcium-dependent protein kinase [Reticulomyxa filosa]
MVFGFPPFFDENEQTNSREQSDQVIYSKIKKGFNPKIMNGYGSWFPASHVVSASCRDLISRLLRTSVADRITAEEALEHPWMKEGTVLPADPLQRSAAPTVIKSMLTFRRNGGLQAEILGLLKECNYLNPSQIDEVTEFFKAADTDANGLISREELHKALQKVDPHISDSDVDSIFRSMDANNDGFVDYDEMLTSRVNRKLQSKEERLRKVFQAIDLDDNGKISQEELKATLESATANVNISDTRIKELIEEADKNHDGEIDFEEFLALFRENAISDT